MFMHRNMRNLLTIVALLLGVVICSHSTAFAQPAIAPLFAILLGANEVNTDVTPAEANAGDLNGNGSVTLIITDPDTICFAVIVNGIARPVAMHIHRGVAGTNGPVVVPFELIPESGNPGTSSGCVTAAPALLRSIRNEPSGFYFNIHNGRFPSGALRGQLF